MIGNPHYVSLWLWRVSNVKVCLAILLQETLVQGVINSQIRKFTFRIQSESFVIPKKFLQ